MRYVGFEITDFKGIKNISFDFRSSPKSPIHLLVGLNESGKTTVLEALSFFYDNLEPKDELTLRPNVANNVHDLIPKRKKDNFNGTIEIKCNLVLDELDIEDLRNTLDKRGVIVDSYDPEMQIGHTLRFINSKFYKKTVNWIPRIRVRSRKGKKITSLSPSMQNWNLAYDTIVRNVPALIYYPNFLFDFPDRIFLESSENEGKEQLFYRQLLQDILDSLNNNLDLKTHVIERAKTRTEKPWRAF